MKSGLPILTRRAFLAAGAVLATGSTMPAAFADTLDDIKAKGVLVIGSGVVGSKPWMYKNEDGTYGGMEYEMLQYIIKRWGVPKVEVVDTAWETLIPGLKAKRWDIIFSGMTVTEERRQGAGIEFTRPYYFESDRIVVKKDSPFQKPEDLAGKTFGVPLGTVEEIQAKSLISKGIGKDSKAFESVATVFQALNSGQVDAIVMDNTSLAGQLAVTPDLRTIGGVYNLSADPKWQDAQDKAPYKYGGDGAGVRKEDTALLQALNEALDAMDADGTREAIFKKYGVWDESLSKESMMTK
jgi:ABC-type amino acid transport substrate-binding protein